MRPPQSLKIFERLRDLQCANTWVEQGLCPVTSLNPQTAPNFKLNNPPLISLLVTADWLQTRRLGAEICLLCHTCSLLGCFWFSFPLHKLFAGPGGTGGREGKVHPAELGLLVGITERDWTELLQQQWGCFTCSVYGPFPPECPLQRPSRVSLESSHYACVHSGQLLSKPAPPPAPAALVVHSSGRVWKSFRGFLRGQPGFCHGCWGCTVVSRLRGAFPSS